jgi:hypothetical protein
LLLLLCHFGCGGLALLLLVVWQYPCLLLLQLLLTSWLPVLLLLLLPLLPTARCLLCLSLPIFIRLLLPGWSMVPLMEVPVVLRKGLVLLSASEGACRTDTKAVEQTVQLLSRRC